MSIPETTNPVSYVASAKLANKIVKAGVDVFAQGEEVDGVRCFVFEWRPENTAVLTKYLGARSE
jgi:hypothetical protein